MQINPFSIPPIISMVAIFTIAAIVLLGNRRSLAVRLYFLFSVTTCGWLLSYSIMYNCSNDADAILWARVGFSFIAFIPVLAFHFVVALLNRVRATVLLPLYLTIPFALYFGWTNHIYNGIAKYFWGYYPTAGDFYIFFLILFFVLFTTCAILCWQGARRADVEGHPVLALQLRYVFYAFMGGSTAVIDYVVKYKICIYPWGYISTLIFISLIAYAIIRYRFMDIRLAIMSAGLFLGIYALALGAPFYLYAIGFKLFALILAIVLASIAPFIYFHLQRRAADSILEEQRRYQAVLKRAAMGMGRVRDLKKLLNLIVSILTRSVRMEHALVYIFDEDKNEYSIGAISKMKSSSFVPVESLSPESVIVKCLQANVEPLVLDEMARKLDPAQSELCSALGVLHAALVFPIYSRSGLMAMVVMGNKEKRLVYSDEDIAVFMILSSQMALAIENAKFYEDMKKTQAQLFQAEKMATIGTMADGVAHQINNRFHCMGLISSDALDTINLRRKKADQSVFDQALVDELENALKHIQDNVFHGRDIVRGLLQYTRKGEEGLLALNFKDVFEAALNMLKFKISLSALDIVCRYDENLPKVRGNFTQLQEVLFNLVDNAYDAMMQRKDELADDGYRPTLIVSAQADAQYLRITFEDNGMGVKEEDKHKLFVPFFTTKATAKKGTGLGLYVIKKIVEENHQGQVMFESTYKVGSKLSLAIPLAVE